MPFATMLLERLILQDQPPEATTVTNTEIYRIISDTIIQPTPSAKAQSPTGGLIAEGKGN